MSRFIDKIHNRIHRHVCLFATVCSLAIGVTAQAAQAIQTGPRVAVVAGLEPDRMSTVTVEFYREVVARLQSRATWRLVGHDDVRQYLATDGRLSNLGRIAAIDRKHFVRAVSKRGRLIRPVQAMADTLALDGVVLVDCQEQVRGKVSACAVYYYDRGAGRIMAGSTKHFRVAIADPTRWASVLTDQLIDGLASHRASTERAALERMVREESTDSSGRLLLEASLGGMGLRDPKGRLPSLPIGQLSLGRQGESYAAALYGEMGQASSRRGDETHHLAERGVGVTFAAHSRALESLHWELGMSLGVHERLSRQNEGAVETSSMRERQLRLKVYPGMLWDAGDATQVGPALYWMSDMRLSARTSGESDIAAVRSGGWGVGLRFRVAL